MCDCVARARRAAGVMAATLLAGTSYTPAQVTALADEFVPWICQGPLIVTLDALTYEQGSSQSVPTKGDSHMAKMTDTQQFTAHLNPVDAKGFPTTDVGPEAWTTDDPTIAVAQPAADGMSCVFAAGNPGTTAYHVNDGTRQFDGSIEVDPGLVQTLSVTEDAPVEQTPAGP
jgi:hypothetical protein